MSSNASSSLSLLNRQAQQTDRRQAHLPGHTRTLYGCTKYFEKWRGSACRTPAPFTFKGTAQYIDAPSVQGAVCMYVR